MCTSTQGRFLPKPIYIYFFIIYYTIITIYIPSNSHLGQVWGNAIGRLIVLAGSACVLGFHQWQKDFVCSVTFPCLPSTFWFLSKNKMLLGWDSLSYQDVLTLVSIMEKFPNSFSLWVISLELGLDVAQSAAPCERGTVAALEELKCATMLPEETQAKTVKNLGQNIFLVVEEALCVFIYSDMAFLQCLHQPLISCS